MCRLFRRHLDLPPGRLRRNPQAEQCKARPSARSPLPANSVPESR
jgi:hypothetical protein